MTEDEKIKLRKNLVLGALHDGTAKTLPAAVKMAAYVYSWIMTGVFPDPESLYEPRQPRK